MDIATLVILAVAAGVLMLFELPRMAVLGILKLAWPPFWAGLVSVFHTLWVAHRCVMMNMRPREVVLMMKEQKPTSASNQDL